MNSNIVITDDLIEGFKRNKKISTWLSKTERTISDMVKLKPNWVLWSFKHHKDFSKLVSVVEMNRCIVSAPRAAILYVLDRLTTSQYFYCISH